MQKRRLGIRPEGASLMWLSSKHWAASIDYNKMQMECLGIDQIEYTEIDQLVKS